MAKTLVLAEKPSVGKELARVLGCRRGGEGCLEGERYIVTWALGHLVELAPPEAYDKAWEKWDLLQRVWMTRTCLGFAWIVQEMEPYSGGWTWLRLAQPRMWPLTSST